MFSITTMASVPCSTALACGFFDFKAPLNNVFLGSFPAYVIVSRERSALQEIRPLFDLIMAEVQRGGDEPCERRHCGTA